jgi:hypothetical protein
VSEFFEPPRPPPEPPAYRQPVWAGSPENELGVSVPLSVELARTDRLAVAVLGVVAFSTGFSFHLAMRRRTAVHDGDVLEGLHHLGLSKLNSLRFGIQFSDGRKATTLGRPFGDALDESQGPVLSIGGGGGGGRSYDANMWVWPLPPPGPLAFVCEWLAEGITLTRREVDAQPIVDAARRSDRLWAEDASDEGGSWTGYGRFTTG